MKSVYPEVGLGTWCGLFGKSRQAYYERRWHVERRALQRGLILDLVRQERKKVPGEGARKLLFVLKPLLALHGIQIGRDRFLALLRQENLLIHTRPRRARTTDSKHWLRKYPNLAKDVVVEQAEQLWVSDITYIRLRDCFAYLILITDAYSRRIMGYEFSLSLDAAFCVMALRQALQARQFPERALMHHSDRGVQYCSAIYVEVLQQHHIQISMTQNGDPYENALAERMNGILKVEFGLDATFDSFEQAEEIIRQSIHHYNSSRPHASCNYLTPQQAHQQQGALKKRWKPKAAPAGG